MNIETINLGKVLDIATGIGQFVKYLQGINKNFESFVCIDDDEKMISEANRRNNNEKVTFKHLNAYHLPFSDESYDTVSISNSLHHFENPSLVLSEAIRVLKRGGTLIISEMCRDEDQTDSQKSHILLHHWTAKFDRYSGKHHDDTFLSEQLIALVNEQNLSKIEHKIYNNYSANKFNEEVIDSYVKVIDRLTSIIAIKKLPNILIEEGQQIKGHIIEHGFEPARNVLIMGVK